MEWRLSAQKQTSRPIMFPVIKSANGVAERQRIQNDRREYDWNKNPVGNPVLRQGQDGANDQNGYSTRVVSHPQGITECDWPE